MTVRLAACGSRRRIQGLIWAGWTGRQLAGLSGLTETMISRLACGAALTVTPDVVEAVEDLYDRAWQGPRRPSTASRRRATAAGWAPPLAWDDDTIDDPAARPVGVRSAADDRPDRHATADLAAIGCTDAEIAAIRRVEARTIRAARRQSARRAEARRTAA